MTAKPKTTTDPEKAEEARHVAEEAMEARQQGNPEEAKFLAGEAKALDPKAAAEVLDKTAAGNKGSRR